MQALQSGAHRLQRLLQALHREALTHLIKHAREQEGGLSFLRSALEDPSVAAIFAYHELIKAPQKSLRERLEEALETVRPTLESHEGDCRIVRVEAPVVEIALLGSCHGCTHSEVTVKYGIEEALKAAAPEIERVVVLPPEKARNELVGLRGLQASPFAPGAASLSARGFEEASSEEAVPEGDVLAVELERASVLLTRHRGEIRAFPNACTHLGMPLDGGDVKDGILTCPYHAFEYVISSGECITAPETQLPRLEVEVVENQVWVQTHRGEAA
ncbi:MAG: NifU family protein [Myxococcota bacterium]